MQKFNLHTHTHRCGHAIGLDEQYIKAAIKGGFKLLGISDHIAYEGVYISGDRMTSEETEEYLESINRLKDQYKKEIDLKVGFESEYFEDREDEIIALYNKCDYLILGQHCKYIGYEYDCYCGDEDVIEYVEAIEKAMSLGIFTYLAHPDYFMYGRREYNKTCEEAAHRIAQASIKYDVPLEVNLKCIQNNRKIEYYNALNGEHINEFPYPFRSFWEVIAQYGCKTIFGYDSHVPYALLERKNERIAKEVLKELNLNFIEEIEYK